MRPLRSLPSAGGGLLTCLTLSLLVFGLSSSATAELLPSSHLLVPYFEVDLARPEEGLTTVFSVVNSSHRTTNVRFRVHSNWGIPVLELTLALRDGEVRSVNLRDWIGDGNLPDRQLSDDELAHLQAALTGKPSPKDSLYYSSENEPGLAAGYVTIYSPPTDQPGMLWGDVYTTNPERSSLQAGTLVNLDGLADSVPSCKRHAVPLLNPGDHEHSKQLVIWTGRRLTPSPTPEPIGSCVDTVIKVRDEAGSYGESRSIDALSAQVVEVGDLDLQGVLGWLDIRTDSPALVGVHVHATTGESAELRAFCLPEETLVEAPSIQLRPLANGENTDYSPGPAISMGGTIDWEYQVSNAGIFALTGIAVVSGFEGDDFDLAVTCPKDALDPGESMTCTAQSTASVCENRGVAVVTAKAPNGTEVSDSHDSYYYGQHHAALSLSAEWNWWHDWIQGFLRWTNTGDVPLSDVVVSGPGYHPCEVGRLEPGESTWCYFRSDQYYDHTFEVTGKPPCGPAVAARHSFYVKHPCWLWPWLPWCNPCNLVLCSS